MTAATRWLVRTQGPCATLVAVLALTFLLVGCKAQQTNMKLKKANELLGQAEQVNAQKYAPDLLQQARDSINSANKSLAGGDASTALQSARQAVSLAEQALEKSKQLYATEISNEAKAAVETADRNSGSTEDPQRYQNIKNLYDQIATQRSANKWDDVIATSRKVIDEVDILLKRLKNEADRTLVEAQNRLKALKAEGGQQYAPERVIEVTDLINQVENYINEKRDYINARNQAEQAIQRAQDGIIATKREKSKEQISKIESLIVEAMDEGAQLYTPTQLKEVNQLYDSMTADFQENKFDKVLLTADQLGKMAENLVFTTKKAAANARIEKLVAAIGQLSEAGVREYLPGRVEVLEKMLADARQLFVLNNNEAFDKIKQISQDALVEETRIRTAFSDLALEEIRKTRDQLDKTQAVYDKMQAVFIIQPRPGMSALDLQFENAKEALRTELGAALENAKVNLEVSRQRQQEGKYRGSIVLAKDVGQQGEALLNQIYHVVSFNALMELEEQVSHYERDGGQDYAAEELRRTKTLLDETRALMAESKFKDAVSKAADARAQMELMVQRIAERASDAIAEAKAAVEKAQSAETVRYRRDQLNAAVQLIDVAQSALATNQLKNAVQSAEQATEKARTAAREALKLAAEDELETARSRIARAQNAGAAQYASKEFDDANRLLQSAQRHFSEEDFAVAREIAGTSSEKADRAFYRLIDQADAAINEAKSAGGWDFNRSALASAIDKNDEARRIIETGAYSRSASLARQARSAALDVAVGAKLRNYSNQVDRIADNLERGRRDGRLMFEQNTAVGIERRLVELQDQFDRSGLSNYEYTMNALMELEAQLRSTLDTVQSKVPEVIAEQRKELEALKQAGTAEYAAPLLESARRNLNGAEIDLKNGLYKSTRVQLTAAINQIDEIKRRKAREDYAAQVESLFNDLRTAERKFSTVLSRSPDQLKSLALGDHGAGRPVKVAGIYTPTEFREEVEKIYSRGMELTVPEEERKTQDEVVAALNDERLSALSFEKMVIFDRMSQEEANKMIDTAFSYLEAAHSRIYALEKDFSNDQTRFRETTASAGFDTAP